MRVEYLVSKFLKKLRLRAVLESNIDKTVEIASGTQIVSSSIARYTDIGYDCFILNTKIGPFCSFGTGVRIGGATHSMDWVSTSTVFNENPDQIKRKFAHHTFKASKNNTIGADVWIGDYALIKAGLTISEGAVIGMGSVVTKDIPPYEIWAGNPAKKIGQRFSDEVIRKLITIKWYERSESEITEMAQCFNDINLFLKKYYDLH